MAQKKQSAAPANTSPTELAGWLVAVRAAESKKAMDLKVLDLREVTSFTDYFILCTGANARQNQAVADEILAQLKKRGERVINTEGYEKADWILLDFGDFLVHIFSEKARDFYDLERLWRHGKPVEIPAGPGAPGDAG